MFEYVVQRAIDPNGRVAWTVQVTSATSGLLHRMSDSLVHVTSRGLTSLCGHDCVEFDRSQPAESSLTVTTLVHALDPGGGYDP
jgi:hypothetical protein